MRALRLQTCIGLALAATLCASGVQAAQGFAGHVHYTGGLGPVNAQHPLCLCLYSDPELSPDLGLGCLIFRTNPAPFELKRTSANDYYLVAFLDLDLNEGLDPGEPYEIYQGRAAPPADPVSGASGRSDVDFLFGDENLPGAPTGTPTPTASLTPTPSPTPSAPTPTVRIIAGDCDGDGSTAIDELLRAVTIALGVLQPSACPAADVDHDGDVRIDDLIAALNAALDGAAATGA